MREVEPGTVVTVDRSGPRRRAHRQLETRPHTDDRDTSIATVRSFLEDIVRRQLVADVPRCTLLSGGLDSSAMTALAARQLGEHGEKVRSFAVDFVGQSDHFVADELRAPPTPPSCTTWPAPRPPTTRTSSTRTPWPTSTSGEGDQGPRPPHGLRRHGRLRTCSSRPSASTPRSRSPGVGGVASGGYLQFFDEGARSAETFPWLVRFSRDFGDDADACRAWILTKVLDLESYVADGYRTAVAGIRRLDGESDFEYRMRRICHLHLTRFVRVLLDRKDRASTAVGLEVRVPDRDHRLVEYVYNTPWSRSPSTDGKSLLREAIRRPDSQVRVRQGQEPHPSTQDPKYAIALQDHAKDLLARPAYLVFDLVDRQRVHRAAHRDSPQITQASRRGLERTLDLALWLDMYAPDVLLNRARSAAACEDFHHEVTGSHTRTTRPTPSSRAVNVRPKRAGSAETLIASTRRASGSAGSAMVRRAAYAVRPASSRYGRLRPAGTAGRRRRGPRRRRSGCGRRCTPGWSGW